MKEIVELPHTFRFPFAVQYGENDFLLLWAQTNQIRQAWCKTLTAIIGNGQGRVQNKPIEVEKNQKNGFVVGVYSQLERTEGGVAKELCAID